MLGRRGPLSKLIGGGIGLARESQAHRNEQKQQHGAASADSEVTASQHESNESDSDVETFAQDLDTAQSEAAGESDGSMSGVDEVTWIEDFTQAHPPPPYVKQQLVGPLSMPVIIPERRPGYKTRGFVKAYAPVLQDAGIDQETWLEFLAGLDKSISQNKWFHVANVAVWVAGKVRLAVEGISVIARFVTMAIHLSLEAGRRTYMNAKQNDFLDRVNEEFFKPRGLYCFLIKYDPKSEEPDETVDVTSKITAQINERDSEARAKWKKFFQGTAGKVKHEEEVPEFAPLVFPDLDALNDEQKKNAVSRYGSFLGEYYDRRAQAKFDARHDGSKLAAVTGEKEFASRYSDPNHPASQGGLVSTLSGGNYQYTGPLQKITQRRNDRREKLGISRSAGKEARTERRNQRPMRRFLKQDVLYLMVANLPTKEEMDVVLNAIE